MKPSTFKSKWSGLSRRVRIIVGGGFLVLMMFAVIFYRLPPKLTAGQVIDECGLFRYPSGGHQLEINKTAENNMQIIIHRRVMEFSLFSIPIYSRLTPDQPIYFGAERDWFVSVDHYQRLWIYHGPWDLEWGVPRQMPSGGYGQFFPAVLMQGSWFEPNGKLVTGGNVVSMTGYWDGVPPAFFELMPKQFHDPQEWPDIPPVPEAAPTFTKQQETLLYKKLKK